MIRDGAIGGRKKDCKVGERQQFGGGSGEMELERSGRSCPWRSCLEVPKTTPVLSANIYDDDGQQGGRWYKTVYVAGF